MLNKKVFSFLFLMMIVLNVNAQLMLSLDSAIAIALKNNTNIQISGYQKQQSQLDADASKGNFMPEVFMNAGLTKNNLNLDQKYTNGLEVNKNNVGSQTYNASVNLDWTLFDGMKMFVNRNLMMVQNEAAALRIKETIENTVTMVMAAYYAVVQQRAIIQSQQSNLDVTAERLRIIKTKKDVGSASQLEVMQAQIDFNNQKAEMMRQQMNLQLVKSALSQLLVLNPETDLDVTDSITINYKPTYNDLKKSINANNYSLKIAEKNIRASELFTKEYKAAYFPQLDLLAGYTYNHNKSEAGFLLSSDNIGLNYGLSLSWTLFNKLQTRKQYKQSQIDISISKTDLIALQNNIDWRLVRSFNNFEAAMQIVQLENENLDLANNAVQISLERFKLGKTSILELKDSQNAFQATSLQYINSLYSAKLNEIELMRLNGELVK